MHNIKKYAALFSLLIISGAGIYLHSSDEHNLVNITPHIQHTNESNKKSNEESDKDQVQPNVLSTLILRKNNSPLTPKVTPLAQFNTPKSLINTDPSSLVHTDADHQLILNHDIKVLFDYFFSAQGDLSPADLHATIQQYIVQAYPQPAAQQALALLNKYVDYKQRMENFHAQSTTLQELPELNTLVTDGAGHNSTLQTIETLMQDRQDMREQVFTLAETEAMFGRDINYDQYMLTIAKLDSDLSPTERQQQITLTAEQFLTESQRKAREQTFILQNAPPNFRINDNGDCQGNDQDFNPQQVTALCDLARKRLARSKSNS